MDTSGVQSGRPESSVAPDWEFIVVVSHNPSGLARGLNLIPLSSWRRIPSCGPEGADLVCTPAQDSDNPTSK